jgi:hypothetical protein
LATITPFPRPAGEPRPRDHLRRERLKADQIGLEDAPLGRVLTYWRSLRTEGKIPPPRSSLNILELQPVMGYTHIIDCSENDPEGFWFRLYGSRVSIYQHKDFTKYRLADVPPVLRDAVMEDYLTVKSTGCPMFHKMKARLDWSTHSYTRLVLPLADDSRRVSQLLISFNARPLPELGELPW